MMIHKMVAFVVIRTEVSQDNNYQFFTDIEGIYLDYPKAYQKYLEIKKEYLKETKEGSYEDAEEESLCTIGDYSHCVFDYTITDFINDWNAEIQLVMKEVEK